MPSDNNVLCTHCGKYLPRKQEREHRRLTNKPYLSPAKVPSRLRRVVDADSDSDNHDIEGGSSRAQIREILQSGQDENERDTRDLVFEQEDTKSLGEQERLAEAEQVLRGRWMRAFEADNYQNRNDYDSDSDPEDDHSYLGLVDSDNESNDECIDWDSIEAGSGLSNWDQLGEHYEKDAADIGKYL